MTHDTTPKHTNDLASATSPYLLQHAHNPVQWKQWGDDAFDEARQRDVPVLLSIGYATCYWCHVMERESFENEDTARLMNEHFVCIKLDREQHPEIDELYMAATTITTGSGGWPLNVFLDPHTRAPFQCTTYSPPKDMYGRPAFTTLLSALADAWSTRRDEINEQSARIAQAVREQLAQTHDPQPVGEHEISRAVTTLLQRADLTNGGFVAAPKFPQPVILEFLLDTRAVLDQDTRSAIDRVLRTTLDAMGTGGLFDHIAGGFRRYCVDETWTVPHFEKMLYDNAQLLALYARAASVYDSTFYASIAHRTASFLTREMTVETEHGPLFMSAIDAEVQGREGLADLWTPEELHAAISDPDDADRAAALLGLRNAPNFQDPHHPEAPPAHVPRLHAVPEPDALALLERVADDLRAARDKRELPTKDDKAIAAWNAMAAQAFLVAGRELNDESLTTHGRATLDATAATFWINDSLKRSSRNATTEIDAPLEDHAALLSALAELARTDPAAVNHAASLFALTESRFAQTPGAFFDTDASRDDLFARARTLHDGATPSAIGVLTHTLAQLASITDDPAWADHAAHALRECSAAVAQSPASCVSATRALLTMLTQQPRYENRYEFSTQRPETAQPASPISVFVSEDRVELTEERPAATFRVALDIAEPYHVVAADPGESDAAKHMVPLRVGLVSGQGVAVYADYPEGTTFGDDAIGRININTGRLEFDVALELAPGVGASPGNPELGITYQACNDTACQAPRTVRLGVELVLPECI